jgi:hypothetical protein
LRAFFEYVPPAHPGVGDQQHADKDHSASEQVKWAQPLAEKNDGNKRGIDGNQVLENRDMVGRNPGPRLIQEEVSQ